MAILFFDTETSDLPNYKSPPGPHQPHVVQLAAVLAEGAAGDGPEQVLTTLIRPEGWTIDPGAENTHGITLAKAAAEGISIAQALDQFDALLARADLAVAHNTRFDRLLMDSEYVRLARQGAWPETFCTMQACTNILRLPGRYGFKWPRLDEAHQYFFGAPNPGAHDALSDVRACQAIFQELSRRGLVRKG
ncbi:MAG: 3'-5' exonuclease [Planctomycetota bacterium]|nr:3'-5' exonuclease [Planctomycetota bacterium]